jgi:hypothetical protein
MPAFRVVILAFLVCLFLPGESLKAQTPSSNDPFQSLSFLLGTWTARTNGNSRAEATGSYAFVLELKNHIMARRAVAKESCKGPDDFDCQHSDLLYIYPDGPKGALQGIYFDNEGHVIKYSVSTPTPSTAVFLSDASTNAPQFRLVYERKADTMDGRFQMRMPGQGEWRSYLEWSGEKK